jgi:hypothetical protein
MERNWGFGKKLGGKRADGGGMEMGEGGILLAGPFVGWEAWLGALRIDVRHWCLKESYFCL